MKKKNIKNQKAKKVQSPKKQKKMNKKKREPYSISYKKLHSQIRGYGFNYSFKSYMSGIIISLAVTVGVSYFFNLELVGIAIIAIVALMSLPIIIRAQYIFLGNNQKFEQLITYMEKLVISFKQNPKILTAMESTLDVVNGKMKECVLEAIDIIKNEALGTMTGDELYIKAFKIIEDAYPSSRLRTLHRFILNVERENSVSYQLGIDSLRFDIREWVTRTYQYQAELANIKKKIIIIIGLSLGIASIFAQLLVKVQNTMPKQYHIHIVSGSVYQISTIIFILLFIIIYTLINTKINGQWLINDISTDKEDMILKFYDYIENYDEKKQNKNAMIASLFGVVFIAAGIIISSKMMTILGVLLTLFIFFKHRLTFKRRRKAVENRLMIEFPIWMRDVSTNLNSMVVVKAMEESYKYTTPLMRKFLDTFFKETEKDPNSMEPFMNFFGEYSVSELSSAIKSLYTIRVLSVEDSQRELTDMVQRNQELIATSEKMRNQDAVAGISFISMVPMLLLSFKLILDLGVMLVSFLSITNTAF